MGFVMPVESSTSDPLCGAVLWLAGGWGLGDSSVGGAAVCECVCACALYCPTALNVGFVSFWTV